MTVRWSHKHKHQAQQRKNLKWKPTDLYLKMRKANPLKVKDSSTSLFKINRAVWRNHHCLSSNKLTSLYFPKNILRLILRWVKTWSSGFSSPPSWDRSCPCLTSRSSFLLWRAWWSFLLWCIFHDEMVAEVELPSSGSIMSLSEETNFRNQEKPFDWQPLSPCTHQSHYCPENGHQQKKSSQPRSWASTKSNPEIFRPQENITKLLPWNIKDYHTLCLHRCVTSRRDEFDGSVRVNTAEYFPAYKRWHLDYHSYRNDTEAFRKPVLGTL